MTDLSPEVVGRMVAHFRSVAAKYSHVKDGAGNFNEELREVRAIVALLPEQVDPDLVEARKIAASFAKPGAYMCFSAGDLSSQRILEGRDDETSLVQNLLVAIKRGRELARAQAGGGASE